MEKNLLQFLLFFITYTTLSQERQTLISGKVVDSLGTVKNVNIINLKTNKGTFSSDDGLFRIYVKEGDSLQISSVQHITRKLRISKEIINNKFITIRLGTNTFVLDEFELKKHHLIGRLGVDIKEVPTDRKDSLLQKTLDFSKVDFKLVDTRIDANIRMKPPIVSTVANSFGGGGGSASIPFKYKDLILRKELNRKKEVPDKILSELGEQFFFEELEIPKDNYFHFLEYCNPLGIEDLHKEGKVLELIKIFQKESVQYLKIIKKE
ncbi:peptidase associated/transthyretin-like domain-containing protein [Polaribacter atrinae]|uniref:TonB-dependent receptor n=1 Tax=Polaribacter atrinae TaxID=1333662 RepID=A0A176TAQ4_9FLAO|nr:hypothetical protein [Polaribacter atrinae]OAD44839.1 hypothetical protein LPB303_10155 [Polaribacter atrinae]